MASFAPSQTVSFQSTSLHEGRLQHLPHPSPYGYFNPRPYTRDDQHSSSPPHYGRFQSTSLHEGRRTSPYFIACFKQFQSTSLHEGRQQSAYAASRELISIHVPTRGTTSRCRKCRAWWYFNPRPYTRDDTGMRIGELLDMISIHVPTRGTTNLIVKNRVS